MSSGQGPHRLWGGRFATAPDSTLERLNNSFAFDCRLWREDVEASIAHAEMLGETGVLPPEEAKAIIAGLRDILAGVENGTLRLDPRCEDVHTAVEALLHQLIGPVAGKLHTARSRNDQVATDLRLYMKRRVDEVSALVRKLQSALLEVAEREMGTLMPGYTHLQHAQPVLLSHHLLAYFWMFERDRSRLADWLGRADELPLGAGALAGTTFAIDPERVARRLGFARVANNSMDAVSDRDFALEFLSVAAILMVHCSRLGEELVLWSSQEFGFVTLADEVTTGSSIMPQKKNPDVAELARGKAGRVFGHLMALLSVMKSLPLTYNKDMQEDKEPVFDTIDTLLAVLPALELTIRTATFHAERMEQAMAGDFSTATDLADALVQTGIPFRKAHELVGQVVRACVERGRRLEDLSAAELRSLLPEMPENLPLSFTPAASVASRTTASGTAPSSVAEQLRKAKAILGAEECAESQASS